MPGSLWKVIGHSRSGDVFPVGIESGKAENLDEDLSEGRQWNGFGCYWREFGGEWDEGLGRWERAVYDEADDGNVYCLPEY